MVGNGVGRAGRMKSGVRDSWIRVERLKQSGRWRKPWFESEWVGQVGWRVE